MPITDPGREQDRQAIFSHIASIFKAYIAKDMEAIRKTHHAHWKGFTARSRATIHDGEQYLREAEELLKHQDWKFFEITDEDVAFLGETAVATYIARISGQTAHGMYFENKLRVMDIYARTGGDWSLAASHVSLHPDEIDRRLSAAIAAPKHD
jgi:ketosteroid isomerase-like protein